LVHFMVLLLRGWRVAIYHPQDPDPGSQAGKGDLRQSREVRKDPPEGNARAQGPPPTAPPVPVSTMPSWRSASSRAIQTTRSPHMIASTV